MEDRSLLRQCFLFKTGLLNGESDVGKCDFVCLPLAGYIEALCGIKNVATYGIFQLPNGDGTLEHWWIKFIDDGRILDPTASQLELYGFPKLPDIYLGEKPEWYPTVENYESQRPI